MYPALLIRLVLDNAIREAIICTVVPGLSFLAVSIFRKKTGALRPYELYPISPLIHRDKSGDSFPSRHIFSIMLIGGLWFIFSPPIGSAILLCGVGLAVIRVIGGVHFIRDVVCGAILGIAAAALTRLFL